MFISLADRMLISRPMEVSFGIKMFKLVLIVTVVTVGKSVCKAI